MTEVTADPRWTWRRPWCDEHRVAADRLCGSCGTGRCASCAGVCGGCELDEALRAVLAGADRWDDPGRRSRDGEKVAVFARSLGDARDVLVVPRGVVVRPLGDGRFHSYLGWCGPAVARDLRQATRLPRIDRAVVARARPTAPWRRTPDLRGNDEIVWVLPVERGIEARFRPIGPDGAPEIPIEIPASGPWALPEPWTPPATLPASWATFEPPGVACPHCSARHERLRAVRGQDALVCATCGRSFDRRAIDGP